MQEILRGLIHDNKPPPIRRSDLEDLAESICRWASYFIHCVIEPVGGELSRADIGILQRYLTNYFSTFSAMPFHRAEVACSGEDRQVFITIKYFEEGGAIETAHMEFLCESELGADESGNIYFQPFQTLLKYMAYE